MKADIGAAINERPYQIDIERKIRLTGVATELRQFSTSRHGNIEGWKISHLFRDAQTVVQADEAELRLAIWRAKAIAPIKA
ncbi:hypothetical protein LPB73_03200 [Tardiphaga sp. 37S4]|uniref:hypothetical protein n=1 Tax=Tardiphaga sp. 37S4 TaxID=1404741 RepID=UPI001E34AABB|nr:hypothetical protein [Tardiphaga sp. 37S4]UFS76423.1 hypothetical protein LPB73_03200 [Tardiphaga sp. 37S4]